jgi:sugar lactone lactonase YvrE
MGREILRCPTRVGSKTWMDVDLILVGGKPGRASGAGVGIAVDNAGNIYVGDLIANAIGVIRARDRGYEMLVQDPRLQWPSSPCFGPDGRLYVASSQLHLSPFFQGREDRSKSPFPIFRARALGTGVPGR